MIAAKRPALLLAWSALLFALCLTLFSFKNDFPFWYHPDEPGKAEQVLTGDWNFHHPMLLLSASRLATRLAHVPADKQSVVVAGRFVSAAFAALAVVAFSLLAFQFRGFPGALAAGLLLALHHQIFELAHYMKEDTALLLGIALSFLAIALVERKATAANIAFLGAACAIALSGKYLGGIMLAFALPVLFLAKTGPGRGQRAALFLTGFLVTLLLVNLPLIEHLSAFRASFDREMNLVVEGQRGMTRRVPHAQYWNVFIDNTTPALWLFLAWRLVVFWRARRDRSLAEWMITAFPIAFALLLSFSPKSNDRYFLPATALFTVVAALGALDAADWLTKKMSARAAIALCMSFAVLSQLPSFIRYWRAFQHDDRVELADWIRAEIPPNAILAQDSRAGLPSPDRPERLPWQRPLPQRVASTKLDADSLTQLTAQGVTHVVASESDYGRYFLKSLAPQKAFQGEYARRRAFYEELFTRGTLLWSRPRGTVIYLHPGLQLYRLPPG